MKLKVEHYIIMIVLLAIGYFFGMEQGKKAERKKAEEGENQNDE